MTFFKHFIRLTQLNHSVNSFLRSSIPKYRRIQKLSSKPSLKTEGNFNFFSISLLVIPVSTFCLGTWQVKRRKWKLALIKDLEDKVFEEPIDLPFELDKLDDLEYRRVKVQGKFDHSREIYISPRSKIVKGDVTQDGGGLMSSTSGHGVHVVTPFILADRDLTILVNRGWVHRKQMNPKTRPDGQIEDTVQIVGVVRKNDKRQPFMPKNDPSKKTWHNRDIDAMATNLNCDRVFIDADFDSSVGGGGPLGGQTRVTLRNEHLSYIMTWYSLSAITSYMWYSRFLKKLPK